MSEQNPNPLGPEGSYYEAKVREQARDAERKWDALYPLFIVILFFVLGALFGLWHPGWMLFLTIPLYYMKPKNAAERWLNPVMIVLIYLVLGFFFNLWHPAWIIFFAIPVAAILKKPEAK
jgi:multidrug efflux pump subunit AcrB